VTAIRWPRPPALPDPGTRRVVVEASAGTGKTFFLEHRVADLVIAGGATLDQILVVTFTEKATRELRARIRDLLDRMARATAHACEPGVPAWTLDDAARARLADAALAFDRAPIHTIHAFCQRVLVEDAFAGRRLFDQTQIPDEAAFDDAFLAVLRARFALAPGDLPALRAWLRTGRSVERLRDLLLDCLRADAPIAPAFSPSGLAAAAAAARDALAAAGPPEGFVDQLDLHASTRKATPGWIKHVADALVAMTGDAFADLAAMDPAHEYLAKLPEKVLPAMTKARGAVLPALGAALSRLIDQAVPFEAAIASSFLPPVLERIGIDKRERGQFDYQDMLRLVHGVLLDAERGPILAARLRRRHPWALIDEFQDTDPVQWDIFHRVWNASPDPTGGLMIVGDPKQAIYGFRGADVHTYLRARDELVAAGAAKVVLDVNRRSSAALVDAVNALLQPPLGKAPFFTGGITYDHPVSAAGEVTAPGLGSPVRVFELAAGNGDGGRQLLARIADEVEALIAAAPAWQKAGEAKAITAGDLMVLTRTNGESADVARALRGRGVPCTLLQAERLFEQIEAQDLADLLDAVAAPRDRSHRLRAWATAFFSVPWDGLGALADAPDDHPLVEPLFAWGALAQRRDYERLFARILDDTRYAERALLAAGGERAIANTQQVIELLLREVARARGEIHELVRRLRRWIADGTMDRPDDRDVQRIETDVDAVQVMTVHRAKGLEAPIVFLYGGTSNPPGRVVETFHDEATDRRAAAVGKVGGALKGKVREAEAAENQRLAYVALTRARVRLYLPAYPKVSDRVMYQPVHAALDHVRRGAHAGFVFEALLPSPPPAPATDGALDGLAFTVDAIAPAAPAPTITGARAGRAVVSYTRLAHDRAAGGATAIDAADFDRDETGPPPAPPPPDHLPGGAATGLFIHEVLEHVDLEAAAAEPDPAVWGAMPEVAAIFAAAARHNAIEARYLPHAHRMVHATLTTELDTGGETLPPLVRATHLSRELEFAYPLPGAPGRGFVRGVIDLLVRWDGRLWIADYKTDTLAAPTRKAAKARVDEKYEIQARLYGLAGAKLVPPAQLGGLLYWFVRDQIVVPIPCTGDALADWERWLERVEVTP
jgi:exodeoxyribonuclease V beta subunit